MTVPLLCRLVMARDNRRFSTMELLVEDRHSLNAPDAADHRGLSPAGTGPGMPVLFNSCAIRPIPQLRMVEQSFGHSPFGDAMSLADQPPMVKDEVADIGAALAAWYGSHCSIRRLRAIDESVALTVLVALEPTSDGDDTLPVWLAKQHEWTNDLTRCTDRAVQLKLIASSEFETHAVNGAAVIAELDWREAWTSAPESGREQSTGWRSP